MQMIQMEQLPDCGASLTGYLHDPGDKHIQRDKRPCVVVFPGGGYHGLSSHEAEPVALRFYTAGYQAFVLRYSIYQDKPLGLAPLIDASQALLCIRENSGRWRVDAEQIAVCGFSAGGHLAASLGTLWNHETLCSRLDTRGGENRPDALILSYPVITAGKHGHKWSMAALVGAGGDASLFSLESQAGPHTPPTFLWHTGDDAGVPVENSFAFLRALRKHGVPFEGHLYDHGPHGMGLADEESGRADPHIATWSALCVEWLDRLFAPQHPE